jgi:uncharacterized protein YcfJ
MRRILASLFLLALVGVIPLADALAQTGRGALSGAVIGGAIGGRRGAAIGAATGAIAGSHRRHSHGHYYWHHGRCWVRTSSGRSHEVSSRYCR